MSTQQLIKKNPKGGYNNIFPKTFIDAIKDKLTGASLTELLLGFNCYFLSYMGNNELTRLLIPNILRKEGLWITYVLYDHTVITEYYNSEKIDDESWKSSSNWRIASNMLVGDISISSEGNWIVNGVDTKVKAQGEQGITPQLRVGTNNKLQVSYNNGKFWKDISDYISPKFRWVLGTGTTAGKIQISMDLGNTWSDLSNNFTNYLRIQRYIGANDTLPTSGVEEGAIYMKGPTYAEDDTLNEYPIYRMWIYAWNGGTLAWQDNGEFQSIVAGVVQETGESKTEVMSQAAVTRELTELELNINAAYNKTKSSEYISHKFSLGSGESWYIDETNVQRHIVIPTKGDTEVFLIPSISCTLGWLTSAYEPPTTANQVIPYAEGTARLIANGQVENKFIAPSDASYLCLVVVDGAGASCEWDITLGKLAHIEEQVTENTQAITKIVTNEKSSDYTQVVCSLGSDYWYSGGTGQAHIVIPIEGGDLLNIKPNIAGFYGWLTSAYATPPKPNQQIPYASGTTRILAEANVEVSVIAPSDAAYLCLVVVDGAGASCEWDITLGELLSLKCAVSANSAEIETLKSGVSANSVDNNESKALFAIMSYNVGSWYDGSSQLTPDNLYETYLQMHKAIINRYDADIICLQEYRSNLTNSHPASEIYPQYKNVLMARANSTYYGKAIISNRTLFDGDNKVFDVTDGVERNFSYAYTYMNGRKVLVISAHLALDQATIKGEVEELISFVNNEEYFIICVDTNVDAAIKDSMYQNTLGLFADAGFILANDGKYITYPNSNIAIDNIIVSPNIVVKSCMIDNKKIEIGIDGIDHLPFVAYVEVLLNSL